MFTQTNSNCDVINALAESNDNLGNLSLCLDCEINTTICSK